MKNEIKFLDGFKRFKKKYILYKEHLYNSMKDSQSVKTMIVACCDSRVDPAILMDCELGDLFIVRNIANLIPPPCDDEVHLHHSISAALEFAVNYLEVERIIIMGHADCGGIKALWYDGYEAQSRSINDWVSIAQLAKRKIQRILPSSALTKIKIQACEQQAILISIDNLLMFPYIHQRVESGLLSLHGWYFDIKLGELLGYNFNKERFEIIAD